MAWVIRCWLASMVAAAAVMVYGLVAPGSPVKPEPLQGTPAVLSSTMHVVERAQVWHFAPRHDKSARTV